ncbi:hypothetical protein PRK78_006503 [Emydomyces testavorans]|uniref:Uncharacterized protein n=1 Tax=Emydomyces testavorans TaxID=2070801 RepID=A0AAF0DLI1_9EURO|nr:hypothetical protein PRK78_006503 [Emydomyces testavorans]
MSHTMHPFEQSGPISGDDDSLTVNGQHHHHRRGTYPFSKSHRSKPRRWPLVLRFIKGAVHSAILIPLVCHALFTVLVVCLDKYVYDSLGLPPTIIPSLSIVVGLILVFRNQTSYNRFWDGRNALTTVYTAARNLTRTILVNSYNQNRPLTAAERQDIERTIRVLVAFPYAVKHYLRTEWSAGWSEQPFLGNMENGNGMDGWSSTQEYAGLLPTGFECLEDDGLSIPVQLSYFVEGFIRRGVERGWYDAPGASQMGNQVSMLVDAYGKMETIKLTPIPIAHLIHQKQVLALFGCVLPFAMVDDMGWWAVPIVSLVIFTLYGIEGIGSQLEDPFGYDRNDIKMDAIVEDGRVEIEAVLNEWNRVTEVSDEAVDVNGESAEVRTSGAFSRKEMFVQSL